MIYQNSLISLPNAEIKVDGTNFINENPVLTFIIIIFAFFLAFLQWVLPNIIKFFDKRKEKTTIEKINENTESILIISKEINEKINN